MYMFNYLRQDVDEFREIVLPENRSEDEKSSIDLVRKNSGGIIIFLLLAKKLTTNIFTKENV